jgi:hypothetical protein
MGHELAQHPVEVALAANEQPVQAFGPGCPHEAFSERVRPRGPNGRFDKGTGRAHNFVERPDELVITVADQEPDGPALVLEGRDQVPGLLGDPWPDRVARHAGQKDLASLEVDEKQHIDTAEHDRTDVEKVTGQPRSSRSGCGGTKLGRNIPRSSDDSDTSA